MDKVTQANNQGDGSMDEKLDDFIAAAKAAWEAMSPKDKEAELNRQRDSWLRAELQWIKDFREGKCKRD